MTGVRDLDGGERVELERAGVGTAPPDRLAGALEGDAVFVHLDLDVLDPSVFPAQFPAPGGLSSEGLRDLLGELAEGSRRSSASRSPPSRRRRTTTSASGSPRWSSRSWSRCCERAAPAGRGAARAPRAGAPRRRRGEDRPAARGRQADRARAARAADRRGHVHRARHPRPPALLPARDGGPRRARRRRDHRLREGRRPAGRRLRLRLHRDGRLDGDDRRAEGHAPARARAEQADAVRVAARLRRARASRRRSARCSPARATCSARRWS